ncbi:MAG: cache domain-containing protein [Chitinispirillaceae bacterium]|nr:cache domain-containing protein [Chitinispirillaceae bacterium]
MARKNLTGWPLWSRLVVHLLAWIALAGGLQVASSRDSMTIARFEKKTRAMVNRAYAVVVEKSHDMNTVQRLFEKDPQLFDEKNKMYIFMHAYNAEKKEAICVAQGKRPALIGKNMWGLRTPTGRLIFQEQIELIAEKDEFWLEYDWLNPFTNQICIKQSFFKKVVLADGRNAWVGCGYWKD